MFCSLEGCGFVSSHCFSHSSWLENAYSDGQDVDAEREGWKELSFYGVRQASWGKRSERLRWGDPVIYPYTGTLLRMKRDAGDNFAESTEVTPDCLGQTGPNGYPSWGQCDLAQDIEEGFSKDGEDAKEYRSSFKHLQGKWRELISSSECSFLWALWFCWSANVIQKTPGILASGQPSAMPCYLCNSWACYFLSLIS